MRELTASGIFLLPPRSHSIISMHRNALIYPTAEPSKFSAFDFSKENSRDSDSARFRELSTTVGQFFALSIAERVRARMKKTVSTRASGPRGMDGDFVGAIRHTYDG